MEILDGKKVSEKILDSIKNKIIINKEKLKLAIIWIGNRTDSEIYIRNKIKKCEYVGIETELFHLEESVTQNDVISLIHSLNERKDINGIILQSPVPTHINEVACFNEIDWQKDVDGFSSTSISKLYYNEPYFISCTPKGIMRLLDEYNISLEGKNVVIINRSNIVGKPLFHLLISANATVTMCHSKTKELIDYTKNADIVISAVGKPNFIKADMIKDGAIVVDVGISRVNDKVVGDVDFEHVAPKTKYITPVPGGIGPMTIAMVIENIYEKGKR